MNIKSIRSCIANRQYEISFHAEKERYAEEIGLDEIEEAIANGEILEDYPDDPRGPSCLILGHAGRKAIHIVCGSTKTDWIRIITVYIPLKPKWIDEKTRAKNAR